MTAKHTVATSTSRLRRLVETMRTFHAALEGIRVRLWFVTAPVEDGNESSVTGPADSCCSRIWPASSARSESQRVLGGLMVAVGDMDHRLEQINDA